MNIHIENPVSYDLIPPKLTPAIERTTQLYQVTFGSRLKSVYLLGSAARGEYKPGFSDFDIRAIVSEKVAGEKEKVDLLAAPLKEEFNIALMELDVYTESMLDKRDWLQFYLLVDAVCVWGEPYKPTFPLPASRETLANMLALHLLEHYKEMPESFERIKAGIEEGDPASWQKFAKRAIRLGNAISILKTGQYTQNSERMVQNIIRSVPEILESINKLNQYRINPPRNLEEYADLACKSDIVRDAMLKYGLGVGEKKQE